MMVAAGAARRRWPPGRSRSHIMVERFAMVNNVVA